MRRSALLLITWLLVSAAGRSPEPFPPPPLELGDQGRWVRLLQDGLAESGFRPGPVDGRFGPAVLGAVHAFQKLHQLPLDGVFRPEDWGLLERPISLPSLPRAPDRVEVDLHRQVLFLIEGHRISGILPVSSGNGETYTSHSGRAARAVTPEGSFAFERRMPGWRVSYLGALYEPFYFWGGYAIHGSPSVPPYPASHGCIRVTIADMDWLKERMSLGMPVYVYGLETERPRNFVPIGKTL